MSPSLIVAERNERLTAKRPRTSFKEALDDTLEELDTQADEGQISSGAYMSLAKRIKTVYDSHSGREDGMKYAVIKMVLEDGNNLRMVPEEVDWVNREFLEELLCAASEKLHDSTDDSSHEDMEDWVDDVLQVYLIDRTDFNVFWGVFDLLASVIPRSPLCIATIFSRKLGELLVDMAYDVDLQTIEPVEYSKDSEQELTDFWVDKFKMFPSDYLCEFMTALFEEDSKRIQSQLLADEELFRHKLFKRLKRSLKRVCNCSTCSQIYRKPPPQSAEAAARADRVAALEAKISELEKVAGEQSESE